MIILENLLLNTNQNPVVCIGSFDGVHLGHKEVISIVKKYAKKLDGTSVVVTFSPPPRIVLNPTKKIKLLSLLNEKKRLLEKLNIDYLLIQKFTRSFSLTTPEDFIVNILVKKLNMRCFIIGFDSKFGHQRVGNYNTILKLSKIHKFELVKVNPLHLSTEFDISSTCIRNLLTKGEISKANKLLGYAYTMQGVVIHGKKQGHLIGFPTANIQVDLNKLLPQNGVYAVKVTHKNTEYIGMSNIGFRPTVCSKNRLSVEIHIFKFNKEIYGDMLRFSFFYKVREEKKFQNLQDLKIQLNKDKTFIKNLFKAHL